MVPPKNQKTGFSPNTSVNQPGDGHAKRQATEFARRHARFPSLQAHEQFQAVLMAGTVCAANVLKGPFFVFVLLRLESVATRETSDTTLRVVP